MKKIPKFESHERLFSKVVILDECWIFDGALNEHGYGRFVINRKEYFAHRVSYSIFNGELHDGLVVDHICRNRKCINPDHLRQVTVKENSLENSNSVSFKNSIKTHCKNGHEFTIDNIRKYKNRRRCRICQNKASLESQKKRRA